ncbi:MAG: hypothetical protein V9G24_16330 [Rhodoblastus sp.]
MLALHDVEGDPRRTATSPLGLASRWRARRASVMVIGSAIAAVAGVFFVTNIGFASANDYVVGLTLDIWVMIVLGGLGNIRGSGALLAAMHHPWLRPRHRHRRDPGQHARQPV